MISTLCLLQKVKTDVDFNSTRCRHRLLYSTLPSLAADCFQKIVIIFFSHLKKKIKRRHHLELMKSPESLKL